MYCEICRTSLPEAHDLCPKCGARITDNSVRDEDVRVNCPYCGGVGKIYRKSFIKFMFPILCLDKKYRCGDCKAMFNRPRKNGEALKDKSILTKGEDSLNIFNR